MGGGDERVEQLVVGRETHYADGGEEMGVGLLDGGHGLVEHDGPVGIVDAAVAADDELGRFERGVLEGEEAPKLGVGFYKVGDAFGRVEASDLDHELFWEDISR